MLEGGPIRQIGSQSIWQRYNYPRCSYICMALVTTILFCARSQESSFAVSARTVHDVFSIDTILYSRVLDLRAEESRVMRHVIPSRDGETFSRFHALSLRRALAIGSIAHGFKY